MKIPITSGTLGRASGRWRKIAPAQVAKLLASYDAAFTVTPESSGQIVQEAYAATPVGIVRRILDRGDLSVAYYFRPLHPGDDAAPQLTRAPK